MRYVGWILLPLVAVAALVFAVYKWRQKNASKGKTPSAVGRGATQGNLSAQTGTPQPQQPAGPANQFLAFALDLGAGYLPDPSEPDLG